MQPKTIKSKNNGCGTAPGNLVGLTYSHNQTKIKSIQPVLAQNLKSGKMKQTLVILIKYVYPDKGFPSPDLKLRQSEEMTQ